jgi:HAD superfamily hydrolase (TIGR01450 family)
MRGSARPLAETHDVALLDLDGVVYLDGHAVEHAPEALAAAAALGMRRAYVTNNALRTPADVAAKLTSFGVPATAEEVVTSAQAAARVLAERLPAGSPVLVCGGAGLREAVAARGLRVVDIAAAHPAGVTSGYDPEMTYARLREASIALGHGALWVASNRDATIPSGAGRVPGAGATVAFLATASGREPDAVAGKPHPALHQETVERSGALSPLVVGDRLDTDIAGAVAAGVDSLLVLTGVAQLPDLLVTRWRPTFLAADLRGLLAAVPDPAQTGWTVRRDGDALRLTRPNGSSRTLQEQWLDGWRTGLNAAWEAQDEGHPVRALHGLDPVAPGTVRW